MPGNENPLALLIGPNTVAENLQGAVNRGLIVANGDGSWSLPQRNGADNWAKVHCGPPMTCRFLRKFLFYGAYAQSAVPDGCRDCYKVKVSLKTVRQLVAAWSIGKRVECHSKWGVDLDNKYSQDIYAGYFYAVGLPMAKAIFRTVREAVDQDPKLGIGVAINIKRGCSDYEAALGRSDEYRFAPELKELEDYLKGRFRENKVNQEPSLPLMYWIEVAFRIGDDTYLNFTGGQRLRPKSVTYDPGEL